MPRCAAVGARRVRAARGRRACDAPRRAVQGDPGARAGPRSVAPRRRRRRRAAAGGAGAAAMTAGDLAAALVERGLDPAARDAKASLFARVLRTVRDITGAPARHAWWVPGRLEVFGKHTDYAGGRTLVCAVPSGLAVAATPRTDGRVH